VVGQRVIVEIGKRVEKRIFKEFVVELSKFLFFKRIDIKINRGKLIFISHK